VKEIVSVVIPTFNRKQIVGRAISSALAQTVATEVIVVDDGSQDKTVEYLLATYGDQIKVVPKSNGGVSSARNAGVKYASCSWVAFLDSDDYWQTDKLASQLELVTKSPSTAMVLTDIQFINKEMDAVSCFQRSHKFTHEGSALYEVLLSPYLIPSSVLILKTAFENLGGFDESLPTAEDLDFHIRVAEKYLIANVARPITVCQLPDSSGLSELDRSIPDHLAVVKGHVTRLGHRSLSPFQRNNVFFRLYVDNAGSASASKKFTLAFNCAFRAFTHVRSWSQLVTWTSTIMKFPKRIANTLFVRLKIKQFFVKRSQ
jgi:glycosyltransferase involved in cell wall biosynthesis